jgi:error-prone DNA polymerase
MAGAHAKGVPAAIANTVFDQLRAFGSYAFPTSHAAAFAVIVYQSAWLKCYHPAAFFCALLNNQPMGFWPPSVLVGDAKRHGVPILPVDIACSTTRCTLEQGSIRLGLNYITGFGTDRLAQLDQLRGERPFANLADLCRRTRLPRLLIERLIQAGALDAWDARRQLLWELGTLRYQADELDLPIPHTAIDLPAPTPAETLGSELGVLGLSTGEHLMAHYRAWLDQHGLQNSATLEMYDDGQRIKLAGLCIVHQAPPTAKGFHFACLYVDIFRIRNLALGARFFRERKLPPDPRQRKACCGGRASEPPPSPAPLTRSSPLLSF